MRTGLGVNVINAEDQFGPTATEKFIFVIGAEPHGGGQGDGVVPVLR